jgi:hypothetical protein
MRTSALHLIDTAFGPSGWRLSDPHDSKVTLLKLAVVIHRLDEETTWLWSVAEALQYGSIAHLRDLATGVCTTTVTGAGPNSRIIPILVDRAYRVWAAWRKRYPSRSRDKGHYCPHRRLYFYRGFVFHRADIWGGMPTFPYDGWRRVFTHQGVTVYDKYSGYALSDALSACQQYADQQLTKEVTNG